MNITTGNGNDSVIRPVSMNGVVFRSNDTIITGGGNDTINAGLGKDDYVDGGEGFDHLIIDYSVDDIHGGMYFNNFGSSGNAYRSPSNSNSLGPDYILFKNIEKFTVTGTLKDDDIKTYCTNSFIKAGMGNDKVTAVGGTLEGGSGVDHLILDLSVQTGNLNLSNPSNISVSGIVSATGFERFDVTTGNGNDIFSQSGIVNGSVFRANDVIRTGGGNDTINAGLGQDDTVYGDSGTDHLILALVSQRVMNRM